MASADVMTASIPVPIGHNVERRHRHHHCHHGPRSPPYNRQHGHRCRHGASSAPEDEGLPSSGVMSLRHGHHHGHGHGFWRARAMGVTGNPETQTPLPETHPDSDDGGLPPSESAGHQHPGHHRHHTGRGRGFMHHGHHHHGHHHHGHHHHSHHGFVPGNVDGVANQVTSNDPELASRSEVPGPSSSSMARVERFHPSHAGCSHGMGCGHQKYKGRHGWKCHRTVSAGPETPSQEPENMEATKSIEGTKEALDALDLADSAPKPGHPTED